MRRSSKLPLTRSAGIAARWPLGLALTSWRYLWRTTPLYRAEEPGAGPTMRRRRCRTAARTMRRSGSMASGPLFHRRYRADISGRAVHPEELMARLQADPDSAAPSEFATFRKVWG